MKKIKIFRLSNGRKPYSEWIDHLDKKPRARVYQYVHMVAMGGSRRNIRSLKDGIFEIKIDIGPGYRVYFGESENNIILLLIGGDKHTQFKDIILAKKYWREYVQKNRI